MTPARLIGIAAMVAAIALAAPPARAEVRTGSVASQDDTVATSAAHSTEATMAIDNAVAAEQPVFEMTVRGTRVTIADPGGTAQSLEPAVTTALRESRAWLSEELRANGVPNDHVGLTFRGPDLASIEGRMRSWLGLPPQPKLYVVKDSSLKSPDGTAIGWSERPPGDRAGAT